MNLRPCRRLTFQSRNRESYLFKSILGVHPVVAQTSMFQSRNRESYLFKKKVLRCYRNTRNMFQSRNRESYLFKCFCRCRCVSRYSKFQSRNRESYLFKEQKPDLVPDTFWGFNLVIENLIFSRLSQCGSHLSYHTCFNLVIENLIFSRFPVVLNLRIASSMFQSRNRESYLFKLSPGGDVKLDVVGVSIS